MLSDYRSVYRSRETGERVLARRVTSNTYMVLHEDGTKTKLTKTEMRKAYKFIKENRSSHRDFVFIPSQWAPHHA